MAIDWPPALTSMLSTSSHSIGKLSRQVWAIFQLKFGVHQVLVVSNWELAKECLAKNDKVFLNRPRTLAVEQLAYNSAMFSVSPYGPYWRELRKIVTVNLLSNHKLEQLKYVRIFEILEDTRKNMRRRIIKQLDNIIQGWLEEHRRFCSSRKVNGEQDFIDTMLDILHIQQEKPSNFELDTVIKATCLAMILGGTDTTTVTLTWALSLLLNNRHVLKKALDELDTVVGKERLVDDSDMKNLVYLQAIIKEAMRLYPAAPLSAPREAINDCNISGYHVRAGTRLFVNIHKIHRNPRVWPDPCEFRPERFLTTHKHVDIMPFTLATLLQAFEIMTPSNKQVDLTERFGITTMKDTPLEVILTPRLPNELYNKYGPIFQLKFRLHQVLVVSNWELAEECLAKNNKVFVNRPCTLAVEQLAYNSAIFALSPYGLYWGELHKIVTVNLLSNHKLEQLKYVRIFEVRAAVKTLHDKWKQTSRDVTSGGILVELKQWIGNINLNAIVRLVAGKALWDFYKGEEYDHCQIIIRAFFELFGAFTVSDALPILRWLDIGGYQKNMRRTVKQLDNIIQGWLEEHRRFCSSRKVNGQQDFIDTMLDILHIQQEKPSSFELDTIIKATCLAMILGGTDTTTVTLTWALSLLLNNHHVLKKALDELDTVVGKERLLDDSNMKNLVYLQAIIKEAMRLYPSAPLSASHEAINDCNISGYHVRAGTRLFVNIHKTHRDHVCGRILVNFIRKDSSPLTSMLT
ncbi:hypothetical protein Nepgr_031481 [Nepenthes gracilis]|uniref:Cytochrome P450 n=1 Tax=Nepenthes gracilis TaxID=150966 RepID=A0AAD3Y569_NEPGR|nr:hypothetical protein Nepgr_031481 [Nepenthes gracilis]